MNTETTTIRNRTATVALVTSVCGLLAQPVLGVLVVALLTATTGHRAMVQIAMHVAFVLPPILGLVSVVLAHVARRRIKTTPGMSGKAAAMSGMIVGYATLAYTASAWLVAALGSYMMRDF